MIVVTTDGSARSYRALPHAAAFARAVGRELCLLTAFDAEEEVAQGDSPWPARLKAAVERIESSLSRSLQAGGFEGRARAVPRLAGESIANAILRAADEMGAEALAMDSRGSGALRHALLGSVAMEVLSASEIPIMVTGPEIGVPVQEGDYEVLATSDGSEASEQILQALEPFFGRIRIGLVMIYVPRLGDRGDRVELEACYKLLSDLRARHISDMECETVVRRAADLERPESVLLEVAAEMNVNALAMSTRGHSTTHHVLLGSFAAACLQRSVLPVILARR